MEQFEELIEMQEGSHDGQEQDNEPTSREQITEILDVEESERVSTFIKPHSKPVSKWPNMEINSRTF